MNTEFITFANPPASLVQACLKSQSTAEKNVTKSDGFLEPGCRNSGLASFAGTLRRNGASEDQIYLALSVLNTSCESPLWLLYWTLQMWSLGNFLTRYLLLPMM